MIKYASVSKRFWGRFLDTLIIEIPIMCLLGLTILNLDSKELIVNIGIALYVFYMSLQTNGYTFGKESMNTRLRKIDGTKLDTKTVFIRELILMFGTLMLVSFIMMLVREDNRGLHDVIAKTYVELEEDNLNEHC